VEQGTLFVAVRAVGNVGRHSEFHVFHFYGDGWGSFWDPGSGALSRSVKLKSKEFLEVIVNNILSKKELPASLAGDVSFFGEISVHRVGFGAMRLTGQGVWGPPSDRQGALAVLRRAVELGVNFIDTADSYGPHVNEELIAEALFPYPDGLVIATKGGWNRPGPGLWTHDASPSHLRQALEGSLKRLRLDRIDVYQLHVPDLAVSFEASVGALAELQGEGKIRLVGLSNVTQEHIERARKIVPIVSVQNRYSFADREWDYLWTIVNETESFSSRGFRWARAEWRARFSLGWQKHTRQIPCRLP
jgi:hypothetical protein